MVKLIITKIKSININRSYGFNDGGTIVVGHYYKNHRPVKDMEDIVFSERGAIVERYAKACGINREDQLHKLVGKEVMICEDIEDGCIVEFLTRPLAISKKLGLNKWEYIVGEARREFNEEEYDAV